jgi:hypothetical protein
MFPEMLTTLMELRVKKERRVHQTFVNMYIAASLAVKTNSQTIHMNHDPFTLTDSELFCFEVARRKTNRKECGLRTI